jgi:glycosyltransferase involved in cell wall biosynthesis
MSKKNIAILSVLKPVDDTRNFEKLATSIGNTNKYAINIIGFYSKNLPEAKNIRFHPIFNFDRRSMKRILASIIIWRLLIKVKPELIIATCSELLIVTVLYKILFGSKIIYDIQENYFRNIRYTSTYPSFVRVPLSYLVRFIECTTAPAIDRFFLAEKVYLLQMKFVKDKALVIENKAHICKLCHSPQRRPNQKKVILYSGTIARHYGIFDAIRFAEELYSQGNDIVLRIIGFAPDINIRQELRRIAEDKPFIEALGFEYLIPHNQIIKEIKRADFCLLPYKKNKSTEGRFPTKLFECLVMQIPVIISPNPRWNKVIEEYNAGILFDFQSDKIQWDQVSASSYYGKNHAEEFLWESEETKVLHAVESLI